MSESRSPAQSSLWLPGRIEWIVFAAIALVICFQLFVPPIIGTADNGDYHRVMNPLGLEPTVTEWSDLYFDHVNLDYRFVDKRPGMFVTSQVWLGRLATSASKLGGSEQFDLRALGAVNAAIYLAGIYLILLAMRPLSRTARIGGGILLFAVGTDVSNVAFFNSFYSESASLVFFALMVGVFLTINRRARIGVFSLLSFFVVAALFVAAKPQNHPLALVTVPMAAVWLVRGTSRATWIAFVAGSLALLFVAAALYSTVPANLKSYNRWNVLYYSLLADSPDPRTDLVELGLDPEFAVYAGQGAFAEGMPVAQATEGFDHGDVLAFLLRHPGRLISLASTCAEQVYVKVDPLNGHFEKSSGYEARSQSREFSEWQRFQADLLPRSLAWLVFLGLLLIGCVGLALKKYGLRSPSGAIAWLAGGLGLMAVVEFFVCLLGDGAYDIVKHLFLFQSLLDACFLIGAVWAAGWIGRFVTKIKKGPVKQAPESI